MSDKIPSLRTCGTECTLLLTFYSKYKFVGDLPLSKMFSPILAFKRGFLFFRCNGFTAVVNEMNNTSDNETFGSDRN